MCLHQPAVDLRTAPACRSPLTARPSCLPCHPQFVDQKKKRFPRQTTAFLVDGISISIGACLGTSPLTAYIESASGIREGARTGIAMTPRSS